MWRLALSLLVLCASSVVGQESLLLEGPPRCPQCAIEVAQVVTLGGGKTPFSLHRFSQVVVDSRGNYVVAPTYNAGEIAFFDATGRYRGSFGRPGQGPGEFGTHIDALRVGNGDTVHVFHENRHTILQPGLAGLVLSRQLPSEALSPVALGQARWAVHFAAGGPVQRLLHILDARGNISRSFDDQRPQTGADPFYANIRKVARARNGGVWSARFNEYRMERWSLDGTRQLVVERRIPWFQPWLKADPGEPLRSPPKPRIADLREDASGVLWILTMVASSDWKSQGQGEGAVARTEPAALYDTVIEAIDVKNGRILAERRVPEALHGFISDDQLMAYSRRMAEDGQFVIEIWRLSLKTSTRRNPE